MATNETNTTDKPYDYNVSLAYYIYVFQGIFILICNTLLIISIFKFKELGVKKEYIIVASLALADAFVGAAYLVAGVWRINVIWSGQRDDKITAWECMTTVPHTLMLTYATVSSSVILVCVSLDRVIAVAAPLTYYKLGTKYAYLLCALFWLFSIVNSTALVYASFTSDNVARVSKICEVSEAVGLDAFARQWYFLIRTISGGVSVVMYIFVPVFYHRYVTASDNGKDSSARRQQLMREKRLMITMGWLAGATFVFLVCGNLARTFLVSYVQPNGPISADAWLTINSMAVVWTIVSPMAHIIVYMWRQKDIRGAIVGLMLCKKHLPHNTITAVTAAASTHKKNPASTVH